MDVTPLFQTKSAKIIEALCIRYALKPFQAAGFPGNFGQECGEFTQLLQGNGDGHGWAQWSGSRRVAFLHWAAAKGLDWRSDDANLGFLEAELDGAYHHVIDDLKHATGVDEATTLVCWRYEMPGVPMLEKRKAFGREALGYYIGSRGLV